MREQNITINHHGRNIAGRAFFPEKRTCPFVVFSHGFNGSGDDFRMQAEVLAENGIIMHGDRDDTVPVEYSVRAREIYQDSHLEIFAGEGHGFSAAGTDKVTQMLVDMVSRSTGI